MARKDKQISRQLEDAGWSLVRTSNHEVWHCSCGEHRAVKPTSMGRGRAAMNFRSYMKKQGTCSVDLKLG